jgi:hypothetical protein
LEKVLNGFPSVKTAAGNGSLLSQGRRLMVGAKTRTRPMADMENES